jgi:hypothetical protein
LGRSTLVPRPNKQPETAIGATTANGLDTGLQSPIGVIKGCRLLQRYLTSGDGEALDEARQVLTVAATTPMARRDIESRWVAPVLPTADVTLD